MKSFARLIGSAILGVALVAVSPALAGRMGGPMSEARIVPAYQSVYFDIPFLAGEPAVVSIAGNGSTILELNIYDSEGNIAMGLGSWDRKIATMNVNRGGLFRVEVRNLGQAANSFAISTN